MAAKMQQGTDGPIPTIRVDTVLDPRNIGLDTVREIESLRPFGM